MVTGIVGCGGGGRGDDLDQPHRLPRRPARPVGHGQHARRRRGRRRPPVRARRLRSARLRHPATRRPPDLFVVEQTGQIEVVHDGAPGRRRSWTSATRSRAGGEQGLLSMAFAPGLREVRAASTSTTPTRAGDTRVVEYTRSSRSRSSPTREPRASCCHVDQPFTNHNGGLVLFGPDGRLYIGLGRRRLRGRPRSQRPGSLDPARQDPAHRSPRPRAESRTRSRRQPVRGPVRRPARDLLLRAAQPVALLVRLAHRGAVDRRRRSERVEEVDLVPRGDGRRGELRLVGL